jgi:hypothetical protein
LPRGFEKTRIVPRHERPFQRISRAGLSSGPSVPRRIKVSPAETPRRELPCASMTRALMPAVLRSTATRASPARRRSPPAQTSEAAPTGSSVRLSRSQASPIVICASPGAVGRGTGIGSDGDGAPGDVGADGGTDGVAGFGTGAQDASAIASPSVSVTRNLRIIVVLRA